MSCGVEMKHHFPKKARVIGANFNHELMTPGTSGYFVTSRFINLSPFRTHELDPRGSCTDELTVVINPEDYPRDFIEGIDGYLWLWFLKPLGRIMNRDGEPKSSLRHRVSEHVDRRRQFLLSLRRSELFVIAPDSYSEAWLISMGFRAVASPPAINNEIAFAKTPNQPEHPIFYVAKGGIPELEGLFLSELLEALGPGRITTEIRDCSHIVCLGDAIFGDFMLELAFGIATGKAVISTSTLPTWGLERGLDYIEVSTPVELFHVVRHILRHPGLTTLMSNRAKAKADLFSAEFLYSQVLGIV